MSQNSYPPRNPDEDVDAYVARVTGEFPAIPENPSKEWVAHYEACQFFCQKGNLCYEGARLLATVAKPRSDSLPK